MANPEWRIRAQAYGPYIALLALFAFMVWVRLRPAERVVTESDVLFSGNDPWYHARMVQYTVKYFPATPGFDPWSYFPYGTARHSGFGGLFDQLIALAAMIVGLGDPSPHQIEVVTAYAPVVFGGLTVIPAYLLATRLMDRWSALVSALFLALVNGQFLTRTIVGVSDHQSAEAFFGTLALLGFIYALETAYVEQPTRADLVDRNWRALRRPTMAGMLGGVAIGSYLMMWGPGVFLVFTMGVFAIIQMIRDHVRGNSTEYLTFSTVVAMLPAVLLTLSYAKSYSLEAAAFSILQPLVLLGIAIGALFLWILSRQFRERQTDAVYFPVVIVGIIAGGLVLAAAVYPRVIDMLWDLIVIVYSFGLLTSPTARTVAEIAPATPNDAWRAYAALFPIAVIGFVILVYRVIQENRPVELLVVLWSLTIASAYFTMIRFGYYMGVTVAILAGYAIWWTAKTADLDELSDLSDLETYQVLVVLIVIVAIVPGNVIAVGGTSQPVWNTAERHGGTNTAWQQELTWVRGNTPEIPMDYYGRYDEPADGDYAYPEGAYGVMSWWDYGHWITYTARRIPDANPFQEGPRPASAYLLAENETRANLILEALPSREIRGDIPGMSVDELRSAIDAQSPQQASEDTRYVMIDDQMAAGKFGAIATWTGPGQQVYFSREETQVGNSQAPLIVRNDRYDGTMLSRLYYGDARGLSHYRLVHETDQTTTIVSVARQTQRGWTSDLNGDGQAGDYVNRRLSSQVFAAVQQNPNLAFYDARQAATVKTFERVPGATLTGQVDTDNATTVFATVQLRTNTDRNITYVNSVRTDDQGQFEITVPYATTDTVRPIDGGTDSAVEARGRYRVTAGSLLIPLAVGNASVPEPAVYAGDTIEVTLEPVERPDTNGTNADNSSSLGLQTPLDPSASLKHPDESLDSTAGTTPLAADA